MTLTCLVCGAPRTRRNKTCGSEACILQRIRERDRVYVIRPLAERFWEKVDKRGPDECWEWQAGRVRNGYGRIGTGVGREIDGAHRVSWQLHFGPIPAGMSICHTCDNPPCVNPAHLFVGTQDENWADMRAKGRDSEPPHRIGEAVNTAVLTEPIVRACRQRYAAGERTAVLASEFGVSHSAMKRAIAGKTWRHVA
jgi:hypothetical protein